MTFQDALQDLRRRGWEIRHSGDLDDPDARALVITGDDGGEGPWTFRFTGPLAVLQTVLARNGLVLRDGRNGLEAVTAEEEPALVALISTLQTLRERGYVVLPAAAETTSGGWDEVATASGGADGAKAVFWNHQSHESAFDLEGELVAPLRLHWAGEADEIAQALEHGGFEYEMPVSDDQAFSIGPTPPTTDTKVRW